MCDGWMDIGGVTEGLSTRPHTQMGGWGDGGGGCHSAPPVLQDQRRSPVKMLPPTIKNCLSEQDNGPRSQLPADVCGLLCFSRPDSYTAVHKPQRFITSSPRYWTRCACNTLESLPISHSKTTLLFGPMLFS